MDIMMMRSPWAARFEAKIYRCPMSGCWLWTAGTSDKGYGFFKIDGAMHCTHRIAWELYGGPIPSGLLVLHKCDVPPCVNPNHLFLGTTLDNVRDKINKGRSCRGDTHGSSKVSADDVVRIRMLYGKESCASIGRQFGLTRGHVWKIAKRHHWVHNE